jgi:hypothetical protein
MISSTAAVQMPSSAAQAGIALLGLPFDTLRIQHAACVQVGLIRRSILESRDFERALASLECLTLGLLARRK